MDTKEGQKPWEDGTAPHGNDSDLRAFMEYVFEVDPKMRSYVAGFNARKRLGIDIKGGE